MYSMCASIYYLLAGVRIPAAPERQKQDPVQTLQAVGVPASKEQNHAVMKGLSIKADERYPSVAALYRDLYGEAI